MNTLLELFRRISPVGDAALRVELAAVLGLSINDRIHALRLAQDALLAVFGNDVHRPLCPALDGFQSPLGGTGGRLRRPQRVWGHALPAWG